MIRFPFTSFQQFNLDWIMQQLKKILDFMPLNGVPGDVLQRNVDGAAWMPISAVSMDIHGLNTIPDVDPADELPIYDNDQQGNYKVSVSDLMDTAPVQSVNGQTGDVVITAAVDSVNGQTGTVVLDASDVGALPDTYVAPIDSVNGQTGTVVLDASDVGALPDTTSFANLYYTSGYKSLTTAINPALDANNDCTILAGGVKYETSTDKKTMRVCGSLRILCGNNTGWRTFEITGADIADFRAGVNEIARDFSCDMYEDITPAQQLWIFPGSTYVNYRVYPDKTIRLFVAVMAALVGKTVNIVFHGDPFQIA